MSSDNEVDIRHLEKRSKSDASYGLSGKQGEDAQPFFRQVAVVLHAVPVGKLEGQQVAAVLRAHSLRQQQGQAVISCKHKSHQSQDNGLFLMILFLAECSVSPFCPLPDLLSAPVGKPR